jgi:unsaturated rhamnogalacturonyl hydrolase
MKSKWILSALAGFLLFNACYAQPELTADSIKNMCKRVASGRLNSKLANGWQVGTYFEGIMALYDLTKEKQYLDSTVAWGTYHKWLSASGDSFPTNFDDVGCYQAYLETYLADPQPANMPHVQAALNYVKRYTYDTCPNRCSDVAWPIIDQFHMAAPSHPRAAVILNDPVMYDSVYLYSVSNARHHYNVKFHLFNSNCSDTNAIRQWWGRGCGWGVCGVCRIHQFLPPGHPGRAWFEQKIRETSAKLLTLQDQTDGMWRSELFTPAWNKEASGSSFFCYELFYGLRNGILDTATYLGPAKKAWKGLIGCVGVDPGQPNLPGWSQGVGGGPSNDFGTTNHDEYTEGAFLMAGNEFYNLVVNGISALGGTPGHAGAIRASNPAARFMFSVVANSRIEIPSRTTGVEFYSPAGRTIASLRNLPAGTQSVSLPAVMNGRGVVIVEFLFDK